MCPIVHISRGHVGPKDLHIVQIHNHSIAVGNVDVQSAVTASRGKREGLSEVERPQICLVVRGDRSGCPA